MALSVLLLALSSPGWGQGTLPPSTEEDARASQQLADGVRLMQSKRSAEAIQIFDKVAASYASRFKDKNVTYFGARSPTESLLYVVQAANANKGRAQVVSANWGYAYYLKGYALLDLGQISEAKSQLQRAVALIAAEFAVPVGAGPYLSGRNELEIGAGDISTRRKRRNGVLTAQRAECGARQGLTGMGFVYVELNRLDDAEAMYRKCLELDRNDAAAMRELGFVQGVKAKMKAK
jgi:Flp pilus assembly protein TadD